MFRFPLLIDVCRCRCHTNTRKSIKLRLTASDASNQLLWLVLMHSLVLCDFLMCGEKKATQANVNSQTVAWPEANDKVTGVCSALNFHLTHAKGYRLPATIYRFKKNDRSQDFG